MFRRKSLDASTVFFNYNKTSFRRFSSPSLLNTEITSSEIKVEQQTIKVTNIKKSFYRSKTPAECYQLHSQLIEQHSLPNSFVCVCHPTISELINGKPQIRKAGHIYGFSIDEQKQVVFSTHLDFQGSAKTNFKASYKAELGESSIEIEADITVPFVIKDGYLITHSGREEMNMKSFSNPDVTDNEYVIITLSNINMTDRENFKNFLAKIAPIEVLEENKQKKIPAKINYVITGGRAQDSDSVIYPSNCITTLCEMLGQKRPHPASRFQTGISNALFRASPQIGLVYCIEQLYGYEAAARLFKILYQNPSFQRGLARGTDYKHLLKDENNDISCTF